MTIDALCRSGSKIDIPGTARGGTRSRVLQSLGVTFTRMGGTHGTGRTRSTGALTSVLELPDAYPHVASSAAQAQAALLAGAHALPAPWLQTAPSAARRWTAAGSSGGRPAMRRPHPSAPARR